MNGRSTKTNLDAEPEGSRTDWARLKGLDDAAIDEAISSDPDAYAVDAIHVGRTGASYQYVVYLSESKEWRWRLQNAKGEVLADSHRAYASRREAEGALSSLREAMLGAAARAA